MLVLVHAQRLPGGTRTLQSLLVAPPPNEEIQVGEEEIDQANEDYDELRTGVHPEQLVRANEDSVFRRMRDAAVRRRQLVI